jgi:hypothetical protein
LAVLCPTYFRQGPSLDKIDGAEIRHLAAKPAKLGALNEREGIGYRILKD